MNDMFENKLIRNIHCSRYVASYVNAGGDMNRVGSWRFKRWLKSLVIDGEHLTDDEVRYIYNYGTNGKLELEENASRFLDECTDGV